MSTTLSQLGRNLLEALPSAFGRMPALKRLWVSRYRRRVLIKVTNTRHTRSSKTTPLQNSRVSCSVLKRSSYCDSQAAALSRYRRALRASQHFESWRSMATHSRPYRPKYASSSELRKLVLNGCRLSSLPDEIGSLAALEQLLVSSNRLTYIPESIVGCKRLPRPCLQQ